MKFYNAHVENSSMRYKPDKLTRFLFYLSFANEFSQPVMERVFAQISLNCTSINNEDVRITMTAFKKYYDEYGDHPNLSSPQNRIFDIFEQILINAR